MTAVNYGFDPHSESVVDPVAGQDTMLCARRTCVGRGTRYLCVTLSLSVVRQMRWLSGVELKKHETIVAKGSYCQNNCRCFPSAFGTGNPPIQGCRSYLDDRAGVELFRTACFELLRWHAAGSARSSSRLSSHWQASGVATAVAALHGLSLRPEAAAV
jgi:hypothetical protein